MDCDPERDTYDGNPNNHPCVMAFQCAFNVVCNSALVGKVFGGPVGFGWG